MLCQEVVRVAIVGAGPSGLVCAKELLQQNWGKQQMEWLLTFSADGETKMDVQVFEQRDDIGGLWWFEEDSGSHSSAYYNLHTNTPKDMLCFSDFPFPHTYPVYPSHKQMKVYLDDYASHFKLKPHLRLQHRVVALEERKNDSKGRFCVTIERKEGTKTEQCTEYFDAVLLCNGRYSKPHLPTEGDIPGLQKFQGIFMHTHNYKHPEEMKGKDVVVIGGGISAADVSVDICTSAQSVTVSWRNPKYIMSYFIADQTANAALHTRFGAWASGVFPESVGNTIFKKTIQKTVGNMHSWGLPQTNGDIFDSGLILSQDFLFKVAKGKIGVKCAIQEVTENSVVFMDGTEQHADVILCATGYDNQFPFLSDELKSKVGCHKRHFSLYKQTFHPEVPFLGFVCHFDLVGGYLPVAELQARWIAQLWSGKLKLAEQSVMLTDINNRGERVRTHKYPFELYPNMMEEYAGLIGAVPSMLSNWRMLWYLTFGPCLPYLYRLNGPGSCPEEAKGNILRAVLSPIPPNETFLKAKKLQQETDKKA